MTIPPRLPRLLRPLTSLFRRPRRGGLRPESQVRVGFDDLEIVCSYPEGTFHKVAWSALTEVRIRTTAEGPFAPDVFRGLHAGEAEPRIVFPQGAIGDSQLPVARSPIAAAVSKGRGAEYEAVFAKLGPEIEAVARRWRHWCAGFDQLDAGRSGTRRRTSARSEPVASGPTVASGSSPVPAARSTC